MPCIRIKEACHNTKHLIDGIELSCKVLELKQKTAEKTNIPAEQQSKSIKLSYRIYYLKVLSFLLFYTSVISDLLFSQNFIDQHSFKLNPQRMV